MDSNRLIGIISILLFLGIETKGYAQTSLGGTVTDENDETLPYVTVQLLRTDSTVYRSTTTGNNGQYVLKEVPAGDYLLTCSYVGYKKWGQAVSVSGKDEQTVDVRLQTDNVQLGQVTVTGSTFVRKADRLVVLPEKQQVKHAATGYDLLYNLMIPGLNVDRQKGTVTSMGGMTGVSLYINGRKADYREVQNLRPRDIEKVEYFDSPSEQYMGEQAVINYITKQYKGGVYVSLDGQQRIGYLNGDYNVAMKVNRKNTDILLYAGHQMETDNGARTEKHEVFCSESGDIVRDTETESAREAENSQYGQLIVRNQTDKRTLNAKFTLTRSAQPDNDRLENMSYTGLYEESHTSYALTDQSSIAPELQLYGSFKLPRNQQLEATLTGSYTNSDYRRDYTRDDFTSSTRVEEDFYSLFGNLTYVLPLQRNNSLSIRLYHHHNVSASTYRGDYDLWQHLWSAETILFVGYKQSFGKRLTLGFQPGVSSLQYRLHGEERISSIAPRLQSYLIYRPADAHYLQWAVNVGNTYPQISTINNTVQVIDELQLRRGNAEMDNTYLYLTSLTYSFQAKKFNAQLGVLYWVANNMIAYDYYWEDGQLINTFQDGNPHHNLNAFLSAIWKVTPALNVQIYSTFCRRIFQGNVSFTENAVEAGLNLNYYLKDFKFNLYGSLPSRPRSDLMSLAHERLYGSYGLSVGWSKNNWSVEAGGSNLFSRHNRRKEYMNLDVYRYNQSQYSHTYRQNGYIKVVYTFDFGRQTSRDTKNIDRSTKSAILKAE